MNKLFTLLGILTGLTANAQLPATTNQFIPQENYGINYGFENGKSGHVASAGTFTITSTAANVARGGFAASMDFSATGQTLTLASRTIPSGLFANNCVAEAMIKGGDANVTMQVYDGSNVIASQVLSTYATYTKVSIPFVCPSSGTFTVRLLSSADAAIVYLDDVFMGANYRVGTVAQAQFVTKGYFASTGSCSWSVSNSAFTSFGTTSACPGPTIESTGPGFSVATTDTDLPKITITAAKPGYYKVHFSANGSNGSQALMALGVSDGTTTISGPTWKASANGATVSYGMFVNATFLKSVAGDLVLEMKGRTDDASALSIANSTSPQVTSFQVEYFPSASETVYAPNMQAAFGGARWSYDASAIHNNATAAWTTFTDTDFNDTRVMTGAATACATTGDICFKMPKVPAGKYLASFRGGRLYSSGGTDCGFRIYDGTTAKGHQQNTAVATAPLTGLYEYSAEQTNIEYKLQSYAIAGGGGCVFRLDALDSSFDNAEFVLIPIEQGIPMPVIVNSVQTNYSGQMTIVGGRINNGGSATIAKNYDGKISSVNRTGAGTVDVSFPVGTFTDYPICTCNLFNATGRCEPTVATTTSVTIRARSSGEVNFDADFTINCIGPK